MASKKTSNKTTASKGIISSLDVVPNRTQSVQPVSDANSAVGISVYPEAKKNTPQTPVSNLSETFGNPYTTGTPLEYNTYTFTKRNPIEVDNEGLDANSRNILAGYQKRLNDNGYLQALESARNNTLDATNRSYNDNARNYYQMYMTNQAKMPENLSRLGVTGGASETAQLGLMNNYSGNLYNNESQRAQTTANLNAQYDQLVADYSKDLAQQLANVYYDTANNINNLNWEIEGYNNQGVNEQNKYNTEIQNNANLYNWQRDNDTSDRNVGYQLSEMSTLRSHGWDLDAELRQRGYAVEDRDLANSLSMAQYVAEYSGNTTLLKKVLRGMGMTKKQAKAIASDFTKAYNKAQSSNSSTGGRGGSRSGGGRYYYGSSGSSGLTSLGISSGDDGGNNGDGKTGGKKDGKTENKKTGATDAGTNGNKSGGDSSQYRTVRNNIVSAIGSGTYSSKVANNLKASIDSALKNGYLSSTKEYNNLMSLYNKYASLRSVGISKASKGTETTRRGK